jgi:hypothetical protein
VSEVRETGGGDEADPAGSNYPEGLTISHTGRVSLAA